jgi:epoxyqueuosine reductase
MGTQMMTISHLRELAERSGLLLAGVVNLDSLQNEAQFLAEWQKKGFAGEMAYMKRPAELFAGVKHILPAARSVVSFVAPYSLAPQPKLTRGFGRVARYAWGRDYHLEIKERLQRLLIAAKAVIGEDFRARVFTDAVPFLERAAARSAGHGFIGKNTLLIRPGIGSFTFLAEIFTELEVLDTHLAPALEAPLGKCGSCTRCIKSCPTQALVDDRVLDARRCISYLTIEKRGVLEGWELEALGEWVFGCDICQDVCPFNHGPLKIGSQTRGAFDETSGVGPLVDLEHILTIQDDGEFQRRFSESPLLRPGLKGLQRNAIAVAVNTGYSELRCCIEKHRKSPSPAVRAAAEWGIERI